MGEGVNAIVETPGIFSNMLSYTRLIAVGLSKAGMALAVNNIGVKMLILNGNIIAGFLVLLPFHLLIFVLGIIAAGLHSLRLQYVEFFTKFYQGGGVAFNPLREERAHTNA
ncbi:MAG: V-type ATP synthase subunit I, partial [Candidatus Aenigmarchaeota archaeon]|nr:V-type ATP synthase subunit I [Candidatus Aenigmarchaeota archaeon]